MREFGNFSTRSMVWKPLKPASMPQGHLVGIHTDRDQTPFVFSISIIDRPPTGRRSIRTITLSTKDLATCVSPNGRSASNVVFTIPPAVYITNQGVALGATVENVIAKHGAPVRVETQPGRNEVFQLWYCGITFSFDHFSHRTDGFHVEKCP